MQENWCSRLSNVQIDGKSLRSKWTCVACRNAIKLKRAFTLEGGAHNKFDI